MWCASCSCGRLRSVSPDLRKWDAWPPGEVVRALAGVQAPWYVAAGWALDLFVGEQLREHEDCEIAVPRDRFAEVARALDGYELFVPGREEGRDLVWPLAQAGERLNTHHQTWVREPATDLWRLDVFREPSDGDTWICRRAAQIRLPYREVIEHTEDGITYLRPEIVLLFKAKHADRPKDQADFAAVLPILDPARRAWLAEALSLVNPDHRWLDDLR